MNALPPLSGGLLPYWLYFTSLLAVGNSVQAYLTTSLTAQVYNAGSPVPSNIVPTSTPSGVTPLSSRTFGTWTLLSAMVRLMAAFDLHNLQIYNLVQLTYAIAFAHFMSEWLIFRTASWGRGLAGPVIVSTVSLTWMYLQSDFYLS